MHKYIIIAFLLLSISSFGQHTERKMVYKKVGNYLTDLNNDGVIDTITISSSIRDPGDFDRITVKLAGHPTKSFIAKDSWNKVDKNFLDSNKNELKTQMLFIKKTPLQSVILLFGELDGAGYRGEFSIINIENNKVMMVLDDDVVDIANPIALKPFQSGERLCFIYNQSDQFDERLKHGMIGSYVPNYVYLINDGCKLDKLLMKAYNEKYYVFAGYKYDRNARIYYPNDHTKPILLKRRRKQE